MKLEELKKRIQDGAAVHGCWLNTGSALAAEMVCKSGFDWALVDLEHGVGDEKDAFHQLQAIAPTTTIPIVRTEQLSRPKVQRMLDMGAQGIMFPQIKTLDETKFAASTLRYPPEGVRGVATMIRATDFGMSLDEYHKKVKEGLLGIIQIETLESLKIVDDIAGVDGVDVLFIGPADLSMSLGIFRQVQHEDYQKALKITVSAANKHGKAAGVLMSDPSQYDMYHALGFRFLACGADGSFIKKGASSMASALNSLRKKFEES